MPKILVVDDDPDIAESIKIVLESKEYEVSVAGSGKEGLDKARRDKPDLIILDIMMETADAGFNVARELKRDEGCQETPILMLTAIKEKTGFDFKKEAGDEAWLPVDAYADKPLKPDQLLSRVESLLKK